MILKFLHRVGQPAVRGYITYINWFNSFFPSPTDKGYDPHKDDKKLPTALANILLVASVVTLILFIVDYRGFSSDSQHNLGTFGDFFGGVLNPIFTFLTLIGLIATIVIQRQELRLSRVEYVKTADALSTQAIETTFFNMIDLHHKIADELSLDLEEIVRRNTKDEFLAKVAEITSQINIYGVKVSQKGTVQRFSGREVFQGLAFYLAACSETAEDVKKEYKHIQDNHNHILGHYFRNLYQILKIIEENKSIKAKQKYLSILRAQLSTYELAILFINCLDGVCDRGEFKKLLSKYKMLEHLHIKQSDDSFWLANTIPVTNEMVLQYELASEDQKIDLTKYFGGAFGKNKGVPYDLKRKQLTAEK
ncbi:TPA: putative phage abortive infection protein [Vibrio alginolyticus]|nr:putative phage abortive infection protein [Vibrio alginolyticus]